MCCWAPFLGTRKKKIRRPIGRCMGISFQRIRAEDLHYPLVTEMENCGSSDLSALRNIRHSPSFLLSTALKQTALHSHHMATWQNYVRIKARGRLISLVGHWGAEPFWALHRSGQQGCLLFNRVNLCQLGLDYFHKDKIMLLYSGFINCHCNFLRAGNKGERKTLTLGDLGWFQASHFENTGNQQRFRSPTFLLCSSRQVFPRSQCKCFLLCFMLNEISCSSDTGRLHSF